MKMIMCLCIGLLICGLNGGYSFNLEYNTPQNSEIQKVYLNICETPVKITHGPHPETLFQTGGDCDDRARAFKSYLESRGAHNVKVVWVCHEDNGEINWTYGAHEFVVWNGTVYNPTLVPYYRAYNVPLEEYLESTKKDYGYNTYHDVAFENSTQPHTKISY